MYSLQGRRERVRRRPRRLQQVEADLAGFEVHVRVADGGCEGDFGRGEGVGGRDEDVEAPETGCRGGGWSVGEAGRRRGGGSTFVSGAGEPSHDGFPVQDFGFGRGAEGLEGWGWFFDDGLELLEETFGGGGGGGAGGGHGGDEGSWLRRLVYWFEIDGDGSTQLGHVWLLDLGCFDSVP